MKDKLKIIGSMFIFGTLSIFVKNINISSAEIALWRAVMAVVILGGTMALTGRAGKIKIDGKTLAKLFVSGAVMGFNWILLFESYKYASVAVATLCYYFEPVLVVAASYFMFKERLGVKKLLCFAGATAGLVLIVLSSGFGEGNGIKGIAMALLAAVFYAFVVLVNKSINDIGSLERTFFQFVSAVIVVFPYTAATGGLHILQLDMTSAVCLGVLGVVHTGIAYVMYFSAVSKVSGQQASLFGYIDPATAVLVSAFVLRESVGIMQWIGGAAILICTILNEFEFGKEKNLTV